MRSALAILSLALHRPLGRHAARAIAPPPPRREAALRGLAAGRCLPGRAAGVALLAALLQLTALGCDARATSSDPQSSLPRSEQKSREFESCGATLHCADQLRCFEHSCRRTARSVVGDYHAALGAALRSRGKLGDAIAAYGEALARYQADKLALPPEIECAYGSALAASKGKKEQTELAARVLHRCLLAVPVGSTLYSQALADVSNLADVGLDPAALAREQPADLYLTKAPVRKTADAIAISVTAAPPPSGKTFGAVIERIGQPDLRPALLACWEANASTTQRDELMVSFGLKSRYVASEYEDEPGYYAITLAPGTATGAAGAAEECIRSALEPIKKVDGLRDSVSTKLTISMK
jgi:hypothetical protein